MAILLVLASAPALRAQLTLLRDTTVDTRGTTLAGKGSYGRAINGLPFQAQALTSKQTPERNLQLFFRVGGSGNGSWWLWNHDGILSVFMQETPSANLQPTQIHVLDFLTGKRAKTESDHNNKIFIHFEEILWAACPHAAIPVDVQTPLCSLLSLWLRACPETLQEEAEETENRLCWFFLCCLRCFLFKRLPLPPFRPLTSRE